MKNVKVTEMPFIRVAIVEDDPMRLAGYRALLECHENLQLATFSLAEVGVAGEVDVLILGKRNGQNLSSVMQHLRALRPDLRVIVTAPWSNDDAILEALSAGAKGYVDEAASGTELVQAIHVVIQGGVWASRRILSLFVDRSARTSRRLFSQTDFTTREREVLEMLVAGRSNKEIAVPLGIEERTVKAHVAKLMRKVGVQNRIMLSVHVLSHGLVARD